MCAIINPKIRFKIYKTATSVDYIYHKLGNTSFHTNITPILKILNKKVIH